ncbi:hypothetical protein WJX81_003341 [Elliptochloris bilobata]|uniref:NADH:flavin oxidoreductase/NADH oxidase N-terminal domain-containing protein n=1 Tax=Elliptochloris bilobata TaxID=381761 RepID=A0AAW1S352_9CHLO
MIMHATGSALVLRPLVLSFAHPRRFAGCKVLCSATVETKQRVVPQTNDLLSPYKLKDFQLEHRIVLAPLTRCRAIGSVPQPAAQEYYRQHTTKGGLLIAEATCISTEGHGYPQTPGIYTQDQIEAWRPVMDAVHEAGGVFFLQLWHCGRASHPDFQPGGALPLAPSALSIGPDWKVYTPSGKEEAYVVPQAIDQQKIAEIVQQYADGARNAIAAGFDGVEIHGANGYIIDQFLKTGSNHRTDEYGGPIENRARFAMEVTRAVAEAVGPERTAIRLSPFTTFLDAIDEDPVALGSYMAEQLNPLDLAYLHMVEPRVPSGATEGDYDSSASLKPFREIYKGTFMVAGGFDRELGIEAIRDGSADLVAYGRLFLANPDLPERFALDAPLNRYDRSTFYTFDQVKGYLDYPFLDQVDPDKAKELAALAA